MIAEVSSNYMYVAVVSILNSLAKIWRSKTFCGFIEGQCCAVCGPDHVVSSNASYLAVNFESKILSILNLLMERLVTNALAANAVIRMNTASKPFM